MKRLNAAADRMLDTANAILMLAACKHNNILTSLVKAKSRWKVYHPLILEYGRTALLGDNLM
jgi:hypothetical protein